MDSVLRWAGPGLQVARRTFAIAFAVQMNDESRNLGENGENSVP